ncbi:MAG: hemolysin D [Pseudomonadota bacterium]
MIVRLKSLLAFAIPVGIALAVLVFIISGREPPRQLELVERKTAVRVLTVKPEALSPRLSGYGQVEPSREWNAVAQVAGPIDYLNPDVRPGAILQAGQEIIRISPVEFEIAKRQAEADLEASNAKLQELKAQMENSKASLEIDERSLKLLQVDLDRKTALLKRGSTSQSVVDEAERALLSQQTRVQELKNSIRLSESQIAAQESQIAATETRVETAKLNIDRTRIVLPYNVRIETVAVEPTQYVGVGTAMVTTYGIDSAEVTASISTDAFAGFLELVFPDGKVITGGGDARAREVFRQLGWSATVKFAFNGRTIKWPAKVLRTAETIDPQTRTVGVIVAVDKPYANVAPGRRPPLVKGMFVEVDISGPSLPDQLLIPRSAVRAESRVWIANRDNRLEIRPVKLAATQGNRVVVKDGLKAGERVVLSDIAPAVEGMLLDVAQGRMKTSHLAPDRAVTPDEASNRTANSRAGNASTHVGSGAPVTTGLREAGTVGAVE